MFEVLGILLFVVFACCLFSVVVLLIDVRLLLLVVVLLLILVTACWHIVPSFVVGQASARQHPKEYSREYFRCGSLTWL